MIEGRINAKKKKNAHRWPVVGAKSTVRQTLMNLEWEIFPHPPYTLDTAPSGFHSCSVPCNTPWKTRILPISRGTLKIEIDDWITSKEKPFYRQGIQLLPKRWQSIVEIAIAITLIDIRL